MKFLHYLLVIIQVAGITLICITDIPVNTNLYLIPIQIFSLLLIAWTWMHLRPGKFHILPRPMKQTIIVSSGPFRWIRHPMYLSLFLFLIPLVIQYFSYFRLSVLIVFFINMLVKIYVEELAMKARFSKYEQYMKKTKRLIPFIY